MRRRAGIFRCGFLLLAWAAWPATAAALTSSAATEDVSDAAVASRPPLLPDPPPAPQLVQAQVKPAPSDNPLWGIPLKELSNTRERPIFSVSRKPPPSAVVAPPPVAAAPPPPKPKDPEQPDFVLLGTIVNDDDGYAIFMDKAKRTPVRVRIGSSHDGWVLQGIKSGVATVEKERDSAILTLPKRPGDRTGLMGRLFAAPKSIGMNGGSPQVTGQTPETPPAPPRQLLSPFGANPLSNGPPNPRPINLQ